MSRVRAGVILSFRIPIEIPSSEIAIVSFMPAHFAGLKTRHKCLRRGCTIIFGIG